MNFESRKKRNDFKYMLMVRTFIAVSYKTFIVIISSVILSFIIISFWVLIVFIFRTDKFQVIFCPDKGSLLCFEKDSLFSWDLVTYLVYRPKTRYNIWSMGKSWARGMQYWTIFSRPVPAKSNETRLLASAISLFGSENGLLQIWLLIN